MQISTNTYFIAHIYRVFQYSKKVKPENVVSQVQNEIIRLILLG